MPKAMYSDAQWRMIHDNWAASGKTQSIYLSSGQCEHFVKTTFGSSAPVPSYATFNQHMKIISAAILASLAVRIFGKQANRTTSGWCTMAAR